MKKKHMHRLREIVNKTNTFEGKVFDFSSQSMIIFSLILIILETIPELSFYKEEFQKIDNIVLGVFSAEYLLRVFVAKKKLKFILSPFGIIDLIAILPFYLSLGTFDFKPVRIFRLIRLLRSLRIIRYSRTIKRLRDAIYDVKEELMTFFLATVFILFLASAGIYHFENEVQPEKFESIPHSFWWAIVTLTTVGYGDMYPITIAGKLFTVIILFLGLGFISLPSALLASSLVKRSQKEKK